MCVCVCVHTHTYTYRRSHWPCDLRCWSAAARLLGLRVRIPPGAWMSVSCECRMLSGRGLCVYLITRPEESYWMWCVWVQSWSPYNEEALDHWRGGPIAPWEWEGISYTYVGTHENITYLSVFALSNILPRTWKRKCKYHKIFYALLPICTSATNVIDCESIITKFWDVIWKHVLNIHLIIWIDYNFVIEVLVLL
jgi:hypothetical protein